MTPDLLAELNAIDALTRQRIEELIDVLEGRGGQYGRRYAEHVLLAGGRGLGPKGPPGLDGGPGRLIRELVLDAMTEVRLYGPPPATTSHLRAVLL